MAVCVYVFVKQTGHFLCATNGTDGGQLQIPIYGSKQTHSHQAKDVPLSTVSLTTMLARLGVVFSHTVSSHISKMSLMN